VENSIDIGFSNCSAGPCPTCGGVGHIPDGVYNFIGDTIELLSCPQRTVAELKRLALILSEAREEKLSPEEIIGKVNNELPGLNSFKDILPKNRNELYSFIGLIISIIMLLLTMTNNNSHKSEITINQVVNHIYEQQNVVVEKQQIYQIIETDTKRIEKSTNRKIGRNERCPCGSGKKYKFCCGNN
jgi:hypothetical protein